MSNMAMKYEDWLRECVHHDGEIVYLPCDIVLEIADWIEAHRDAVPREDYEALERHFVNWEPVVRCKDCKFSEVFQNDSSGVMARYCDAFTLKRKVADDDFCSYGGRRDDETV